MFDAILEKVIMALPWGIGPFVYVGLQLLKLAPAVIKAVKEDPNPNKVSAPIVVDNLKVSLGIKKKEGTVAEPTELKNI